ncbi:MAG: hypothetical protein WC121_13900 [Candidatus Kapaibacterium sp.]|jgi:hypothetical protein
MTFIIVNMPVSETKYDVGFLGEAPKTIKKPRAKKAAAKPAGDPAPVETVAQEPAKVEPPVKPARKPAAKRKAPPPEPEPVAAPEPPKKKARAQKPTVAPAKPIAITEPVDTTKKTFIDGKLAEEAPAWFKKHLLEEAKRRNSKKPKGEKVSNVEVKAAVEEATPRIWKEETERPKAQRTESKLDRMYAQMFSK